MNTTRYHVVALGIICAATLGIGLSSKRVATRVTPSRFLEQSNRRPVLVELFTSEGCSSCPPADKLLAKLQKEGQVITLGEHVDYFNSQSWADPFSSPLFTQRQSAYTTALHVEGPYTPEMVVDGEREFIGSDETEADRAIQAATDRRKDRVNLQTRLKNGQFIVDVSVDENLTVTSADPDDVYLAIAENGLSSRVAGGENGGRVLTHSSVVRKLVRLGTIKSGVPFTIQYRLNLDPGWKQAETSIVGFVQRRNSLRIVGAQISHPSN